MATVHADQKGNTIVFCPHCGIQKKTNVSKYIGHNITIKCTCGQSFKCHFEYAPIEREKEAVVPKTEKSGFGTKALLVLPVDVTGQSLFSCPDCGFKKKFEAPPAFSKRPEYTINCRCGRMYYCRFQTSTIDNHDQKQAKYPLLKNGEANDIKPRVYVLGENNTASIVCEKCGHRHVVDPEKESIPVRPFWFRCRCGHTFPCRIEKRQKFRKKLQLHGKYVDRRNNREDYLVINDLSLAGIGFTPFKAKHGIKEGDILDVNFTLDNSKETEIKRSVRIRNVFDDKIGAEFIERPLYDGDLGLYLLP